MPFKTLFIFLPMLSYSCNTAVSPLAGMQQQHAVPGEDNPYKRIAEIPLPAGFERVEAGGNSFAAWLREMGLKKDRTVYIFNGLPKANQSAQFAVLDISTGDKNLQQCADAVMRLKAEWLFSHQRFSEIRFRDYHNKAYLFTAPYTRANFTKYLERVFGMCGSASLSKEMQSISFSDIRAGDVLIRGGFPGHAVIVADVAVNAAGKKIFILAQSYMPAQDIHILLNPSNGDLSPWYEVNGDPVVETPEYTFSRNELKRWK